MSALNVNFCRTGTWKNSHGSRSKFGRRLEGTPKDVSLYRWVLAQFD